MITKQNKIQYIDGDPQKGVAYDWKKIIKILGKLGIPKEYFNIGARPVDMYSWLVFLSERTAGKTTGTLLLGLVMYLLYGTVTVYCRPRKNQIAVKHTSDLYHVIIDNNYIYEMTGGRYNSITYYRRKWYLCRTSEGEIVDKDPNPCCHMVSIDESLDIKSGLNLPTGDLIILDEFASPKYKDEHPDDFVRFCDIISTIFRMRESGKIVLLGNNVNQWSQIYSDLEIDDVIKGMVLGDHAEKRNGKTRIYVELINPNADFVAKKKSWVEKFMGFTNPELSSITGVGTWAVANYPHIPEGKYEPRIINCYISDQDRYCRLEVVEHETLGICVYAHWATRIYEDSLLFVDHTRWHPQQVYGFGGLNKFYTSMIRKNKIYYASNDVGSYCTNFFHKIGVI